MHRSPELATFGNVRRPPSHMAPGAPSSWGHPSQRLCPGGFRRSGSPPWKMARVEEEPHAMRRRYEQGEPYGAPDPYARQSHHHEHENYGIHEGQYHTEELYQSEEGYRGEEEGEAYEMEAPYVREPLDRFPGPDKASTRNEAFSERWRIAPRDDPYYDDPYKHDGYPDVPEPPRLYERGLARRPPMEARDQHSPVQPGYSEADRQEQDDSETATDLLVNFGGYSGPHRRPSSAPNRKQRLAALLTSLGLTLDDLQDLGTFREEELTPGRSLEILRDISNRKLMNVACTVMGSSEAAAAVSAIAAAATTTATSSRKSATPIVEEKRPKVWDYTHGGKDTYSGCPSPQQKNDYFGRRPPKFPHTCCICNKPLSGIRDWTKHISGRIHQASCEFIKEKYPLWKPENWYEKSKSSEQKNNNSKEKAENADGTSDPAVNTAVVEMELESDTEEDSTATSAKVDVGVSGVAAMSSGANMSGGAITTGGARIAGGPRMTSGPRMSGGAGVTTGARMSSGAGMTSGTGMSSGARMTDGARMSSGAGMTTGPGMSSGPRMTGGAGMSSGSGMTSGPRMAGGAAMSSGSGMSGGTRMSGGAGMTGGAGMPDGSGLSGRAIMSGGTDGSDRLGVYGGNDDMPGRARMYGGSDDMPGRARMYGGTRNIPDRAGISGRAEMHSDASISDRTGKSGGTDVHDRFSMYASARMSGGGDTPGMARMSGGGDTPGMARVPGGAGVSDRSGMYGGSSVSGRAGMSPRGTDIFGQTGMSGRAGMSGRGDMVGMTRVSGSGARMYGGGDDMPGSDMHGGAEAYCDDTAYSSDRRGGASGAGIGAYGGYDRGRNYSGSEPASSSNADEFDSRASRCPVAKSYGGVNVYEYSQTDDYGGVSGKGYVADTYGKSDGVYRRAGGGRVDGFGSETDLYGGDDDGPGGGTYLGERVSLSSFSGSRRSAGTDISGAARLSYGSDGASGPRGMSGSAKMSGLDRMSGPPRTSGGNRFTRATDHAGIGAPFLSKSHDMVSCTSQAPWETEERDGGDGGDGGGNGGHGGGNGSSSGRAGFVTGAVTGSGYERWCFSPSQQSHRVALPPPPERHGMMTGRKRCLLEEKSEDCDKWGSDNPASGDRHSGERAPLGPYRSTMPAWKDEYNSSGGGWRADAR